MSCLQDFRLPDASRALQLFSLRLSNLDEQLKGLSWRMSKSSAWLKTMDGHTDAAARQNNHKFEQETHYHHSLEQLKLSYSIPSPNTRNHPKSQIHGNPKSSIIEN